MTHPVLVEVMRGDVVESLHRGSVLVVDSDGKEVFARGDADAYLRLSPTPDYRECLWDHAAGALVAVEAGCIVTDSRGIAMDFSTGRRLTQSQGVICAPPRLHAELVAALAPLVR